VKISDPTPGFNVSDESDAVFKILPQITVTQPVDEEDLVVDGSKWIQWDYTGTKITLVNISYSVDGGSYVSLKTNQSVGSGGSGSWEWTNIPASAVSSNVVVKVADANGTYTDLVNDISDSFNIIGWINIGAPNGNESWAASTSENITWTSKGVTNVKIYYSLTGGTPWTYLFTESAASGLKQWDIDNDQQVSNAARVRITDSTNETKVNDESTGTFKIVGKFIINNPAQDTVYTAGGSCPITWTEYGSGINNPL